MINLSVHDEHRPAIIQGGQTWTYGELIRRSDRIARNLTSAGIEPSDRVATLLPNCPELVATFLASFQSGFTIVPMDVRYHAAQLNYTLRHCDARAVIVDPGHLAELSTCEALSNVDHVFVTGKSSPPKHKSFRQLLTTRPTAELFSDLRDDDVALVFYTSGTTDRPKGVTLTRSAVANNISKSRAMLRLQPDDVTLIAGPISRPMALWTQLLSSLNAGATVVLQPTFEPDAYIEALQKHPDTSFIALLPGALRRILFNLKLKSEYLKNVRLCICGGDNVPVELFERFHELTGKEVTEQAGMTETGMYALNPPYGRKKRGSVGLPYYGVQVTVVDDQGDDVAWCESGEIAVQSPFAMDGYWNDTAATRRVMRDGRIRTGDIGRFDEDGYLWIDGRKKDIIVRAGSNISPAAIEDVLEKHPMVREACVVGVDDPELGQYVSAFVTLVDASNLAQIEKEIDEMARQELPEYMVPESVCPLARMPLTGSGKIDRQRLKWVADSTDDQTLAILLG
jgi:long-chain acyl-CoA synthetase